MARGPNHCPNCGERVSPFAAGCALCGATLDPRRHQRRGALVAVPGVQLDWELVLLVTVLLVLAIFSPLVGLAFSALAAYDRERRGQPLARNIAIAIALVSALALLDPTLRFGVLNRLGLF